jgi:hypothetical protein
MDKQPKFWIGIGSKGLRLCGMDKVYPYSEEKFTLVEWDNEETFRSIIESVDNIDKKIGEWIFLGEEKGDDTMH